MISPQVASTDHDWAAVSPTPLCGDLEPGPRRIVAVVSDGSRPRTVSGARTSVAATAGLACTQIGRLVDLPVITKVLAPRGPQQLLAHIRRLPNSVAALFLTGVEVESAQLVQHSLAESGGPLVLTDQDAVAVAMAAAVITVLRHAGQPEAQSRVVISGAHTAPLLAPLLIRAGVGEVDSWNPADALTYGLIRVAYGADLVIDLIDRMPCEPETGQRYPRLISPTGQPCMALAIPGILRAALQYSRPLLDIEVFHSCCRALVAATPAGLILPELPDAALTDLVTAAASRAMNTRGRPAHRIA